MIKYLYFLLFFGLITLAIATIYLASRLLKKCFITKVQFFFLLFIIFHSIYICIYRCLFELQIIPVMGFVFVLFYPPFFYWYILSIFNIDKAKSKKMILCFIPGIILSIGFFIFLFFTDNKYLIIYNNILSGIISVQFIFCSVYVYSKFNLYAKEKGVDNIINQFIVVFAVMSTFFIGMILSGLIIEEEYLHEEYILYVSMFILVCIMFKYNITLILQRFELYKAKTVKYISSSGDTFIEIAITNEPNSIISDNEETQENTSEEKVLINNSEDNNESKKIDKYAKSRISEEEIQKGLCLLEEALRDKVYLQSDLTVETLSKKLKIPSYNLTQIFTIGMNSNFNKVINSYRVEHAMKLLNNPNITDTIEDIGLDSGFNSRSSFYRAFKNKHKMTPSDYRKTIINK